MMYRWIFLMICLCLQADRLQAGWSTNQLLLNYAFANYHAQLHTQIPNQNTIINQCTCPVPPQAIPIQLPALSISLQDSNNITINSATFLTNSNFKSRIAILTVQIFPPSTEITTSPFNPNLNIINVTSPTENSYALVYTLQSPDGLYFQKEIQYTTPLNQTPFMAIYNGTPKIPVTLSIATAAAPKVFLAQTSLMQSMNGLPFATQQQLLNQISPITQKFLLTTDAAGNNLTVTPMSTSYDPNSNSTIPILTSSIIPSSVEQYPPIIPTTDTIIPPIEITISSSLTSLVDPTPQTFNISFQSEEIAFNDTDLRNGLILHLYIFSPLYQNGPSSNNFIFIATLQTLDGLKFRKHVYYPIAFNQYPLTFTISATSLAGKNTTITSTLAAPTTTPQIYNMLSPFHVRCRLQEDQTDTVIISIT